MIRVIAAVAQNGVIGRSGGLPWDIPGDRQHFARATRGGVVIMGRRTWEGLPAHIRDHLLGRRLVLLSRSAPLMVSSLDSALSESARLWPDRDIWIAGGAQVYRTAMDTGIVDEVVLTRVLADIPGDVTFPDWDRFRWVDQGQHGWDWRRAEYKDAWGGDPLCRVEVWRPVPVTDAEGVANGR